MRFFLRGLNGCIMRKQKLEQYRQFLLAGGHDVVDEYFEDKDVLIRRPDWAPNPGGYIIKV